MTLIHPTALVERGAELDSDVRVGPYTVIGPEVRLGAGAAVGSHVVLAGRTELGPGCQVHPFAAIGTPPQDMKYDGEPSRLVIGAGTVLREHVTVNPGTRGGGMETRIGDGVLLMVGVHVAHDCRVGDRAILANQATLGGHVEIGAEAFLGGLVAVHQFARIGRGAMIGGMSGVETDIIPYGLAMGNRARLNGLNVVGLKRREVPRAEIQTLRGAYQRLFEDSDGDFQDRLAEVADRYANAPRVREILTFIRDGAQRPLCRSRDPDAA